MANPRWCSRLPRTHSYLQVLLYGTLCDLGRASNVKSAFGFKNRFPVDDLESAQELRAVLTTMRHRIIQVKMCMNGSGSLYSDRRCCCRQPSSAQRPPPTPTLIHDWTLFVIHNSRLYIFTAPLHPCISYAPASRENLLKRRMSRRDES